MADVLPLPARGDVFTDERGRERTMRVTPHPERGVVVVSIWFGGVCRASFQLPAAEAPKLAALLTSDPVVAEPPPSEIAS
jgi:hypothetical protein